MKNEDIDDKHMPFWLSHPDSRNPRDLVMKSLREVGCVRSPLPTALEAWTTWTYRLGTLPASLKRRVLWSHDEIVVWLFVAAVLGHGAAKTEISRRLDETSPVDIARWIGEKFRMSRSDTHRTAEAWSKKCSFLASVWRGEKAVSLFTAVGSNEEYSGVVQDETDTMAKNLSAEAEEKVILEENSGENKGFMVISVLTGSGKTDQDLRAEYKHILGRKLPQRATLPDPVLFMQEFLAMFPWAREVGEKVQAHIMLSVAGKDKHGGALLSPALPPLLLGGPPGIGKTQMLEKICHAFGIGFRTVAAGGSMDDCGLGGTDRKWSSRTPCLPVDAMAQLNCADPAIVVDEIDKVSRGGPRTGMCRQLYWL
ncbi:AAA family ATPase [Acetobacter musti]|uniref:AAA family ATPase n=1 Tax=Acetobacter musti TaxID=864732 RepID=A0ABX0JTL8_9PROT|nr:AAA family ATPase [Acetobacter musti]NHN86836.1 AAA family ATPase [Acetobacter musti]